jgi:hypothetical protein
LICQGLLEGQGLHGDDAVFVVFGLLEREVDGELSFLVDLHLPILLLTTLALAFAVVEGRFNLFPFPGLFLGQLFLDYCYLFILFLDPHLQVLEGADGELQLLILFSDDPFHPEDGLPALPHHRLQPLRVISNPLNLVASQIL